ncbi:unnamed protein product [Timema podura]|uniref:Uncharacterized protein n=1 Tax=Timema podura TaxID=61482 RepID=A0ABN7P314_TIMPD|nr:unnamed protein product [Timema podura]
MWIALMGSEVQVVILGNDQSGRNHLQKRLRLALRQHFTSKEKGRRVSRQTLVVMGQKDVPETLVVVEHEEIPAT